jgi:hypothetical protein
MIRTSSIGVVLIASSSIMAGEPVCGPGEHWVDDCPAGTDIIGPSTTPKSISHATVGITFNSDGSPLGVDCKGDVTIEEVKLSGPVTINRGAGTTSAPTPPPDIPSSPPAPLLDDHHIDTEMVSMKLTGTSPIGPIKLHAGTDMGVFPASLGKIIELAGDPWKAYSYFWVYHKIETPLGILYNANPTLMAAIIDRVPPWFYLYEYPLVDPVYLYLTPPPHSEPQQIIACLLPPIIHELSVTLDYFTATTSNGEVVLEWKTGIEKNNAGFFVWRGQPVDGQCSDDPNNYTDVQAITPRIDSRGTEVSGETYTITDSHVVSGNTYCYALEDRDYNGKSTFHMKNKEIVSATP